MCKKACNKIVATLIIIIALALAISVTIWRQDGFVYIVYVSRFFDVMLPVLGVGALLKYLLCGHHGCCCGHHGDSCTCGHHEQMEKK